MVLDYDFIDNKIKSVLKLVKLLRFVSANFNIVFAER